MRKISILFLLFSVMVIQGQSFAQGKSTASLFAKAGFWAEESFDLGPLEAQDLGGNAVGSAQAQGKGFILHFWSLKDPGSISEAKALQSFYHQYKSDLGFYLLSVCVQDAQQAGKFAAEQRLGFPIYASGKTVKTPATYVLSPLGRVIAYTEKRVAWNSKQMAAAMAALLAESRAFHQGAPSLKPSPTRTPGVSPLASATSTPRPITTESPQPTSSLKATVSPKSSVQPALSPSPVDSPSPKGAYKLNQGVRDDSFLNDLERDVMREMNLLRTDPQGYAQKLRDFRTLFKGRIYTRPGKTSIMTQEGLAAVDEAISVLERQSALPPFSLSRGLSLAARAHARDQERSGALGHSGSDGSSPFDRMNRFGIWQGSAGENISYGGDTGEDIVIQLFVDDGVPGRGHRKNMLSPSFLTLGIGTASHPVYRVVCVQDFAGGYGEK